MPLQPATLRFYTAPTDVPSLAWTDVESQLRSAGTYWVTAIPRDRHPHPRPVWGVWLDDAVWLTLGSPRLRADIASDPRVTVNLESGVDVVVVEGRAAPAEGELDAFLAAYDAKYDWTYDAVQYGPPLRVDVDQVIAWRSGGVAGRDGFRQAGRWTR